MKLAVHGAWGKEHGVMRKRNGALYKYGIEGE